MAKRPTHYRFDDQRERLWHRGHAVSPRNSSIVEENEAVAADLMAGGFMRRKYVLDFLVDGHVLVHHPKYELVEVDELEPGMIPVAEGQALVRR